MADPALIERIARLDDRLQVEWFRDMRLSKVAMAADGWCIWARDDQLPPPWHWNVWLMMAGRGFGKTRAGAEWVHWKAREPGVRIAIVGPTEDEARRVMVEGASGLLSCGPRLDRPTWEPSRGQLNWANGSTAYVYSGANAEGLRGPEHEFAWADEIAKWAQVEAAWANLRFGLRRGRHPQVMVTTTPRPIGLLRRLTVASDVAVTHGSTLDNRHNAASYIAAMTAEYGASRLGRQEIYGELIDDVEGALWTRDMIEDARVREVPELVRVVVGVDPPAGTVSGSGGDACGIVVCGLGRDGTGYVIDDASVAGRSPQGWARAVAQAAARHGADRVVAEANNGGKMVESVLRAADSGLPVRLVHASRGKAARAEPVALLYAAGKVRHVGAFPDLEDELCGLISGGGYDGPGRSPDRADACVWALSELMLGRRYRGPQVRLL
ncbi:DNA-packaging protein [Sphingomonas sp. SUN039]|uniref:DNA-packaging protein n=1 Tax=Sphingomonas sp. SUN039 TaxID=2937787 RepID=UPI0021645F85|nr:terminase family protein [Sphingomonas sp. SUN039]UVO52959.1 terminase family protein [Sphingomonas sp. SUN039]